MAIAYACSQLGVTYILLTSGSIEPSEKCTHHSLKIALVILLQRKSHVPGLQICSLTTCPLLMSITSSDTSWDLNVSVQQKKCWFRLVTTLVEMSIIDMQHLYHDLCPSDNQEMDILQYSDLICKKLKQ